jgi:DNA-binding XRE family transcriptional regulator
VNKFRERIRELREDKGLTKVALGKALGLSHTAIVNWENGKKYPSIFTFLVIAEFFGVTIEYLVGMEN